MAISKMKAYNASGKVVFDSDEITFFLFKEYVIYPVWRPYPVTTGIQTFTYVFDTPVLKTYKMFGIIAKSPTLNVNPTTTILTSMRNICYWHLQGGGQYFTGVKIYAEAEAPANFTDNYWVVQFWTNGILNA